jgi:hypothetical protein
MRAHVSAVAFAAAILAALTIAACGSKTKPLPTPGPQSDAAAIKFADCMRANGVPQFPDPIPGRLFAFPVNGGFNPGSPAVKAAQQRCKRFSPAPPAGAPSESQSARTAQLKFAECMRAHGVSNYPDPSGSSNPRIVTPQSQQLPGVDTSSPAFQQASKVCGEG